MADPGKVLYQEIVKGSGVIISDTKKLVSMVTEEVNKMSFL
jgi:hypothetical protein